MVFHKVVIKRKGKTVNKKTPKLVKQTKPKAKPKKSCKKNICKKWVRL